MKIVFYSNQLCERGTETALIDYAFANKDVLRNESILAFPKNRIFDNNRYEMLKKDFEIILFDDIKKFNQILIERSVDLLYLIVDGKSKDIADEIVGVKTFVHAVFDTTRKHGTYYCAIHNYLNKYFFTGYPVLPHIVKKLSDCKDDMRSELNIPKDAIVYGSYAGKDRFNFRFVHDAIKEIAEKRKDIYFIFMNINNFLMDNYGCELENVIFLEGSTDPEVKAKFINTCDAMIHARDDGETFGLSIAEFSSMNKPIITYKPGPRKMWRYFKDNQLKKKLSYSKAHLMILGKHAITYRNSKKLKKILLNFSKEKYAGKNMDFYTKRYSPEKVMKIFEKIIKSKGK